MNNTLSLCRDHKKKLAATESKLAALQKKQRVNCLRQIGAYIQCNTAYLSVYTYLPET